MTMKFFYCGLNFGNKPRKEKYDSKIVSKTRASGKCNFQNLRIIIVRNTKKK